MSDLKLEVGKTYTDEDNNRVKIENQITLSYGSSHYLAYQGYIGKYYESGDAKSVVYTDKGRGISGLDGSTGFSFPKDLVRLDDLQE